MVQQKVSSAICIQISLCWKFTVDDIAGKGIDYGYKVPRVYEFTFTAGETCATPNDSIPINNDRICEEDERFRISIIEDSLPLGVQAGLRSIATITIVDDDSE